MVAQYGWLESLLGGSDFFTPPGHTGHDLMKPELNVRFADDLKRCERHMACNMQHTSCNAQHTACNGQRASCSTSRNIAAGSRRRATEPMQETACHVQRCNTHHATLQHTSCNAQHATCNMQRAPHNMQRATYSIHEQHTTCRIVTYTCNTQHATLQHTSATCNVATGTTRSSGLFADATRSSRSTPRPPSISIRAFGRNPPSHTVGLSPHLPSSIGPKPLLSLSRARARTHWHTDARAHVRDAHTHTRARTHTPLPPSPLPRSPRTPCLLHALPSSGCSQPHRPPPARSADSVMPDLPAWRGRRRDPPRCYSVRHR
jgi:hypothetical protein